MDDLLLQYMNAEDEPTANERAAAISQALRRKQDLGTLGVLSGGRLAAPGQALLGASSNDAQGLMHAQVARTARLDRKASQEIAGLKDLRDFTANQKEQEVDDKRAERGIDAQIQTARAMQAMAGANLAVREREADATAASKTRLGEGTAGTLAELPVAEQQVDETVDAFKRLNMGGLGGRAGATATDLLGLQNTDTAEFNAKAMQAMQAAGKILEGGKLAAGDEQKYRRMLPQPGDSDAVVEQKASGLKAFLRDLSSRKATALKEAGYAVPQSLDPSRAVAPAADEHAQAVQWARAHPGDPRAVKILQLNGGR